ncbi:hypothetical protein BIW11_07702, partial [Tropilaelaps mercedesae]
MPASQGGEACTLLALTMSDSESDSEVLQFSPPKRKLVMKRKRRRKPGGSTSPSLQSHLWWRRNSSCWPVFDTVPRIGKFLFVAFVVSALIIEGIMLLRYNNRLDRIIVGHRNTDNGYS